MIFRSISGSRFENKPILPGKHSAMIITRSRKRKRQKDPTARSAAAPGGSSIFIPTYLAKDTRKKQGTKTLDGKSGPLADSTNSLHKPQLAAKKQTTKPDVSIKKLPVRIVWFLPVCCHLPLFL